MKKFKNKQVNYFYHIKRNLTLRKITLKGKTKAGEQEVDIDTRGK